MGEFWQRTINKDGIATLRLDCKKQKVNALSTIVLQELDTQLNELKKDKSIEIYFLMGADNLINFHKWHKSKLISQKCNILVFDRHGYKKNSLKSKTFKQLSKANLEFIEFNKVNISSSQLRKI